MDKLSLADDLNENVELDAAFAEYALDDSGDTLSLYEIESQILSLYDQLIELRLERALLESQLDLSSGARQPSVIQI